MTSFNIMKMGNAFTKGCVQWRWRFSWECLPQASLRKLRNKQMIRKLSFAPLNSFTSIFLLWIIIFHSLYSPDRHQTYFPVKHIILHHNHVYEYFVSLAREATTANGSEKASISSHPACCGGWGIFVASHQQIKGYLVAPSRSHIETSIIKF